MKKLLLVILSLSLFSSLVFAEEETTSSSSSTGYEHVLIFGYDLSSTASFTDGSVSSSSSDFDTDIDFEGGLSIGYEYRMTKKEDWGRAFGITYHSSREAESFTLNGSDFEITGDAAEITLLRVYGNLIYRWDSFYIPFGVNLTSVSYEPPSSFDGSVDSTGGLGFNFAIGWFINEKFAIEYGAHSNFWTLEANDDDGTKTDYGDGVLATATLSLKYAL